MPRYVYILSADKAFRESDLDSIKAGICVLFASTEISVDGGKVFTIHSPFGPKDMERLALEASLRFGLHLRAGGQID